MSTGRSVCSLCRSFLLREQPSITCFPPSSKLFYTTKEILQLSRLTRPTFPDSETDQEDQNHDYIDPLSKEAFRLLPPCRFSGKIIHIKHHRMEESHTDVIRQLLKNQVLGFDVECSLTGSRPLLVQLASRDLSILWQVKEGAPFPILLHGILASPHHLKVCAWQRWQLPLAQIMPPLLSLSSSGWPWLTNWCQSSPEVLCRQYYQHIRHCWISQLTSSPPPSTTSQPPGVGCTSPWTVAA